MIKNLVNINQVRQLRKETSISLMECKKALEEAKGNLEKAKEVLKKRGKEFVEKKADRGTKTGIIESYVHQNKKVGVLLEILCESDFVAKSADFQKLSHELCLQIAAMNPKGTSLFSQSWIKDETKTIKDLMDEYITRLGENIIIKRFVRYEI